MWIVTPEFLVLARRRSDTGEIVLESPIHGDIERFCPEAEVFDTRGEIKWIAFVSEGQYQSALVCAASKIDTSTLPFEVEDPIRKACYMTVLSYFCEAFGGYGNLGKKAQKLRDPNYKRNGAKTPRVFDQES